MSVHLEIKFEDEICDYLSNHGWIYEKDSAENYNKELALFPSDLIAWVKETQAKEWDSLQKKRGSSAEADLLQEIRTNLNSSGTLDTLRKGATILGLRDNLKLAEFKPALAINQDILSRYNANRLRIVRQVKYSIYNENSIDLVLFLNGIPISTIELKTDPSAFTAITVDNIKLGDADAQTISTSSGDLKLDAAGSIDASSNVIKNVGTPSASHHAANKGYVDGQLQGLDIKESVRVATTTNGTLSSAFANGQTVDGITLATNDRILLKHQSTASENGIYTVNASGAPTRATDFDSASDVSSGAFVFVEEGTANADNGFVVTTNGSITPGSTAIAFTQFSGAGNVVGGAGLTKSGSTLDVVGTADRITVAADSINIATTYVGQTSITTLGTIGTGTWNGTAIAATAGGTGLTTIAKGSLLVANTLNTITALDGATGGGTLDKFALYNTSTDTWGVSNSLDGGTF